MERFAIKVSYFAGLRDKSGFASENLEISSRSVYDVYIQLAEKYDFDIPPRFIQFALNSQFVPKETLVHAGDHLVFIPPVSGG